MARDKDRGVASSRAEAINHQNGQLFRKIPKITRPENCVMEIDTVRGVISVSQGGRIKFKVSRIPLGRLALPTITVVAAPEVFEIVRGRPSQPASILLSSEDMGNNRDLLLEELDEQKEIGKAHLGKKYSICTDPRPYFASRSHVFTG